MTAESAGKRILKIGQYLAKLWARVECPTFLTHGVVLKVSFMFYMVSLCSVLLCIYCDMGKAA